MQIRFKQKKKKEAVWGAFFSVRFHSDSSIHRSVENVLNLNPKGMAVSPAIPTRFF